MFGVTWEKGNGFKGERMFTECKAADSKGLWEQEGGRKSYLQASSSCFYPEGNRIQGHGVEDHPLGTSLVYRVRPSRAWLGAALAARGCSPQPC